MFVVVLVLKMVSTAAVEQHIVSGCEAVQVHLLATEQRSNSGSTKHNTWG